MCVPLKLNKKPSETNITVKENKLYTLILGPW